MTRANNRAILIVDDEKDIQQFLSYNLEKEGYTVYTANNGEEGVEMALKVKPDLILLDVMMPIMDGIEACQHIRESNLINPLIAFLTSRNEDYSQIAGFEAGGDDYISKPIRPRLLLSKIDSLLRRANPTSTTEEKSTGKIKINREKFLVEFENETLILPKKEFELLEMLAKRPGTVYTRDQIMAQVWGNETIVGERTIDVHIRKLREKLGNDYIRTIKGIGYTFSEA